MASAAAFTAVSPWRGWQGSRRVCNVRCCVRPGNEARVPLLRLEDVYYNLPMDFENVVFKSLNFSVYPGEFIVVTGQNGSGKSTGRCTPQLPLSFLHW